jgi:hypothetical protein
VTKWYIYKKKGVLALSGDTRGDVSISKKQLGMQIVNYFKGVCIMFCVFFHHIHCQSLAQADIGDV